MKHTASSSLAALREDPFLFLLTLAAAATSIAALLLQLAGIIRMPYTLSFVTAPGLVFLLCVMIWAGRIGRPLIMNRIRVGLVAGLVGLVVYNLARWVLAILLSPSSTPFYSIYIFGALITESPMNSMAAAVTGWLYHVTNGVTFGIIYALLAGPARWWYGLTWAVILEVATLVVYLSSAVLYPPSVGSFVIVSLVSHAFFGAVVGLIAQYNAQPRFRIGHE